MTDAEPMRQTVRVRTELAALAKTFDYAVPATWSEDVRVGTRVRVPLHGRSVRGWVVATEPSSPAPGVEGNGTPPGVDLLPLKSWLGWGPPGELVELAEWAAWRWAGPVTFFLRAASPDVVVRTLPEPPPLHVALPEAATVPATSHPSPWAAALAGGVAETMVRLPPATDVLDLVLSVVDDPGVQARVGSVVVLVPSTGWAERLVARLVRRGVAATSNWDAARAGWPVVVGTRTGAWAPVPRLAAAIVLDAHDASYREESAPTYSAVDVLRERGRSRRGADPPGVAHPAGGAHRMGRRADGGPAAAGRALPGGPASNASTGVGPIRARACSPRSSSGSPVPCCLNAPRGPPPAAARWCASTTARAAPACWPVRTAANWPSAPAAAPPSPGRGTKRCWSARAVVQTRPVVCPHCGRLRMKVLRVGVSRLREELSALLGVAVGEVAGPRASGPGAAGAGDPSARSDDPVVVGTEAVLHRVRRAAAVAFLDIDLHLLAPRLSATEETLALLVRAGRLVGGRGAGPASARVQVQTRVPEHPLLVAASAGEPSRVLEAELDIRRAAGLPPFSALALVSGSLAPDYAAALGAAAAATDERAAGEPPVTVSPLDESRFLLQAPGHRELCDLLAGVPRPPGRGLRVEVDPAAL